MHEWKLVFCFSILTLRAPSSPSFSHASSTGTQSYFPPHGCSCSGKSGPTSKSLRFRGHDSHLPQVQPCDYRDGDPWPFCIVEGECSFNAQTSLPNVFYTPCMQQVIDMQPICEVPKDCAVCADKTKDGIRQILSRDYLIASVEECKSACLNLRNAKQGNCKYAAFYDGGCSLFHSCSERSSNSVSTIHKLTQTVHSHIENNVADPTPIGFAMESDSDLDDCRCKSSWVNPFRKCKGKPCPETDCNKDNWCEVFNPPCKTMYKHDTFQWTTCTEKTPVATSSRCRCKATWDLPQVGPNCKHQIGCSFRPECGASQDHGLCAFDEDSCDVKMHMIPCNQDTPQVHRQLPECQCKENWEWAALDPNCINQQGCASSDCWYGAWCLVKNAPCKGYYGSDTKKAWAFCPSGCEEVTAVGPDIRRRYDRHDRTLIIVTYHWPKTKILNGRIELEHLGPMEMVLFDTDGEDSNFSLNLQASKLHNRAVFNASVPMINCQRKQYCSELYVVNIRSTSGFQVVFLRFITPQKVEKFTDKVTRYKISVTVSQCEDNRHMPTFDPDKCPLAQIPFLEPFDPSRLTTSTTSRHRRMVTTTRSPSAGSENGLFPFRLPQDWEYSWQFAMIGFLSFIIFVLFFSIHNLDICCDSLARTMFSTEETGMTETLIDNHESNEEIIGEIVAGMREDETEQGEPSCHPIALDEPVTAYDDVHWV